MEACFGFKNSSKEIISLVIMYHPRIGRKLHIKHIEAIALRAVLLCDRALD